MENDSEIIDLTQSFTYCRAPINLSCSVIELDDSIISIDVSPPSTSTSAEPIVVECETDNVLPAINVSCDIQPKKSTATKNKRRSRTSNISTNQSNTVRERSPHFGDCPVCRDPLGTHPMASTKCGHVYCIRCITQAVKIEKKCPTCRKPLKGATAFHPLFL